MKLIVEKKEIVYICDVCKEKSKNLIRVSVSPSFREFTPEYSGKKLEEFIYYIASEIKETITMDAFKRKDLNEMIKEIFFTSYRAILPDGWVETIEGKSSKKYDLFEYVNKKKHFCVKCKSKIEKEKRKK